MSDTDNELIGAFIGPPGKSAYQSWLAIGNTGTEADFIASLKGDSGDGSGSDVDAKLLLKVDKVTGKALSTNDFTNAYKTKIDGLEGPMYRGTFSTFALLAAGVNNPVAGNYADVDAAGMDAARYIWDASDSKWLLSASTATPLTAAQVKSLYESNSDTNAYPNADKAKVASVATGATANSTDAALRDRSTHTGTQSISTVAGLQSAIDAKVTAVTGQGLITDAQVSKLNGIATGATANDTDANLKNRANHTGTQAIATVSGLQTALDAKVNTESGKSLITDAQSSKLAGIAAAATANQTDAYLLARANQTGVQGLETVNTLPAKLAAKISAGSFRVCVVGTSLIQQNDVATASKVSHWTRGWLSHARFAAKGLWDVPIWQDPTVRIGWEPSGTAGATRFFFGANAGVSGQTLAQIQARIPLILASLTNVDCYVFDGGTNDVGTLSKEAIHAGRVACLELLKATGRMIIVMPILARDVSSWPSGSTQRAHANWVNQQTLEYVHQNPGMLFFDWNRKWINTSNVDGAPFTGYSPDGTHFNPLGGQPVGYDFADFMKTFVQGQPLARVTSQGDVYDATNNPRGNLVANQFCLGTTGNVGTNVTGSVATGLRAEMATTSPVGTATAVASKEVRGDNRGEWQVLTITPGDADTLFYFRTNNADTTHTIPAGTWVQASMEASIGAFNGWQGVSLYLKDNATGGLIAYDMEPFEVTTGVFSKLPVAQMDGMLVTPPIKLLTGSASLRLRAEIKVASTGNGASGTGVVKLGAVELRVCADPQAQLGLVNILVETRNIGFVGDSRAFLSFTNPGGRNTYYRNVGIASAVAAATLGTTIMPTTIINGVAGETSAQINARIPAHITAMQAAGASRTFYIGTTNDRTGGQITVAQSQANVLAAIQMYNNAGISVDLISETPRGNGSSSYELSAQGKIDHKAMHDWMESLAGTNPKLTVHNWWDTWVDPASGGNYYVLPGVTEDGIHPSKIGAYLGSLVSGPKLLAETGNLPSILPTDGTLFNATTAPQGSLIANPMLTGTTGTKESGAAAITGTVPTGWVLGASNIAGLTIAASLDTVNGINYFRLDITGTGTSVNAATPPVPQQPIISLKQAVPLTNIATGDSLRSVASVITQGTNISNAGVSFLLVPAYAVKYDTEDSVPTLPYPSVNTGRRSRETPPYVHDATQTQYELRLETSLLAGTTVNATIWWGTAKTFKG